MIARSITPNQTKTLRSLARHFYALKDALRLEMVALLAGRQECTVKEIATALKKSQPLVSWHLRRLKMAGLVNVRRAGREVYYSLNQDTILQRQQEFLTLLH